jgi:hypothetical protein
MMTPANSKNSCIALAFAYAVNLALALYFAKSLTTLHSAYLLVLLLAGSGLALGAVFSFLAPKAAAGASLPKLLLALVFAAAQAAVAYALARYLFNLPWRSALAYPVGALIAWLVLALLACRYPASLNSLLAAVFLAGGLVVALRLQGVWCGLIYSLALLNTALLGSRLLGRDTAEGEFWERALFFAALLAAGRAALQYYLLQSNYAALGVVVSVPYSYVALFAGVFLPAALWLTQRDRLMPMALALILLGIALPLVLGVFLHVRPMAAYLLGLVTASFLFGLIYPSSYGMGILSYLNLAAATLGLPLFTMLSNLSRVVRLEVLAGIAVVVFLILSFVVPRGSAAQQPQAG